MSDARSRVLTPEEVKAVDDRLKVLFQGVVAACTGMGPFDESGRTVQPHPPGAVDMTKVEYEDGLVMVQENIAPKIVALLEAVSMHAGMSIALRIEIPAAGLVPDGNGGLEHLSMNLPISRMGPKPSRRMQRSERMVMLYDPKDGVQQQQGQLLRSLELGGELRWTTTAHRDRLIANNPHIGKGMKQMDDHVSRLAAEHPDAHPTVD